MMKEEGETDCYLAADSSVQKLVDRGSLEPGACLGVTDAKILKVTLGQMRLSIENARKGHCQPRLTWLRVVLCKCLVERRAPDHESSFWLPPAGANSQCRRLASACTATVRYREESGMWKLVKRPQTITTACRTIFYGIGLSA